MKAFHNDPKIKQTYLDRLAAHAKADEFVKGIYWEGGKGCAIGCTIHSSDHQAYETELGIPEWLAKVEDKIFEGLPNERSKLWPTEFLSSINVGADLEEIKAPFLIFVLESALETFDHSRFPDCKKAIDDVISFWRLPAGQRTIDTARAAAYAAAYAANATADAARAAANAADAARAAAAASATAADAAYAACAAAYAAAYAANAADAARAAAYAANAADAAYVKFADKLLELMRNCEALAKRGENK